MTGLYFSNPRNSLLFAFLPVYMPYSQMEAWKCRLVACVQIAMPTGNILERSKVWTPPNSEHTAVVLMVSSHCIYMHGDLPLLQVSFNYVHECKWPVLGWNVWLWDLSKNIIIVYLTCCPDSLFVTVLFIWDVTGLRGFAWTWIWCSTQDSILPQTNPGHSFRGSVQNWLRFVSEEMMRIGVLMFSDHLTPNGGFTFVMLYSKSELKCKFYPKQAIIATNYMYWKYTHGRWT